MSDTNRNTVTGRFVRLHDRATCHPEKPYHAHGLCRKCYRAKYHSDNRQRLCAASREWNAKHPEYIKERNKRHYAQMSTEDKQKEKDRLKKYYDEAIVIVFELYGNTCGHCGFSDKRALQLDHKEGGGRKLKDPRGKFLAGQILSGKQPFEKFQLLCANCNWIKRWENGECN